MMAISSAMDSHAQAGFKLKVGDTWQELVATNQFPRFRWLHLAGTYDCNGGIMTLFLDGKLIADKTVGPGPVITKWDPIQIGKGKPRPATDPVGGTGADAAYTFDGLIDEVRIYDQALRAEQVASS